MFMSNSNSQPADKCIIFMKQEEQKINADNKHQTGNSFIVSTAAAVIETAILDVKNALNTKIVNTTTTITTAATVAVAATEEEEEPEDLVDMINLYTASAADATATSNIDLVTNTLPNDNNATPMNTHQKTVIKEVTLSTSTVAPYTKIAMAAAAAAITEKSTITTTPSIRNATNASGNVIHENENNYINENDEDVEEGEETAEEKTEENHEIVFSDVCDLDNEKIAHLETPVLDSNNELLDTESQATSDSDRPHQFLHFHHHHHHHHYHHHCKRHNNTIEDELDDSVPKPKRLSDEFYSADDENEDDDDDVNDDEDDTRITQNCADKLFEDDTPNDSKGSKESIERLDENHTENKIQDTIVDKQPAVIEDEISTCSLNLLSELGSQQEQEPPLPDHLNDSSSPHSSISPAELISNQNHASVADVVEELTNQGDEHQQHRIVIENNIFFNNSSSLNNDVQSMDAIERRDFINEQEATASCILGTSSSIVNRTNRDEPRLNLDILSNTFSPRMERSLAEKQLRCEPDDSNNDSSNSSAIAQNVSDSRNNSDSKNNTNLVTTPTSSRTKRSRLNISGGSSSGINLSRSLEKCLDVQQPSSSKTKTQDSHLRQPKLEFFPQNSNDSSSLENRFRLRDNSGNELEKQSEKNENKTSASGSVDSVPLQCVVCSSRSKEDGEDMEDMNADDEDLLPELADLAEVEDEEDEEEEEGNISDDNSKPSTSNAGPSDKSKCRTCLYSSRTRSWKFGPCTCQCKTKQGVGIDAAGIASSSGSSSTSNQPLNSIYENLPSRSSNIGKDFELNKELEQESPFDDWSNEVNSDNEEICTCREYTDDEESMYSFIEELPSRDVDLTYYSMSEDVFHNNGNSSETPTSRNYRKRKLTETRPSLFSDDRKRLALDNTNSKGGSTSSQPTTPTTTTVAISSPSANLSLRTPRSVIPTRDNPPPELSEWLCQFKQWSHVERLIAVDQLIEHCEPTQVRHMMKVIEPQFQRDFISLLPREVALQVLSYLAPKDLLRAAQTCHTWRYFCDDNLLWKEKCRQSGISVESTDRPKRGRVGTMPLISSPWKAAYMRQHIIEMNWRSRPIREPKILKGHDDHVITCLQFSGNRIVSGSDDNTLKVWSAITGKCLRTLVGHTGGVWSSQMSANIIISGSTDRTLKVWNADNGNCIHTLQGHTSTVRCMHLHDKKVVSGSRDATLRVWDIVQGKCLYTLVGHLAAVRCVQYDGKLVVSGAYDYMVKVWKPETEECLHTLQGHTNRVYSLQFDGVHVVSGSLDTSIRVWDVATGTCKHTLMGHQSLTSGMELRKNILVSGNADSTVKVWDTTNGQCLQTLSGPNKHQSAVTCLQFNSRFVITSSDDGTVKLWDVRTGEFIRNLVTLESGGSGGVVWRIRSNDTKLICAVGSRNGTEDTKLMVLDFNVDGACLKCS